MVPGTSRLAPPHGQLAGRLLVFGVVLSMAGGPTLAQDADQQSLKVGEADLYPALRIDYRFDDNVTRAEDDPALDDDVIDGTAVVVRPRLVFVADRRQLVVRATYAGDYSAGSEDALDWADHALGLGIEAGFGARRRAALGLTVGRGHEGVGQNLTEGRPEFADTPVEYNTFGLVGQFTYGAEQARGNLVAGLRIDGRDYTNLSEITDGRDFARIEPFGRFAYRVGGDTRAFVELAFQTVNFDRDNDDRDSIGLFGGLDFTATGRLEGELKLGVRQTSFDNRADDEALLVAGIGVRYAPTSFATLTFDLDREIDNTAIDADVLDGVSELRTIARVGWEHEWSSRFSTEAYVSATDKTRSCPEVDTLTAEAGFEADLAIRRWLSVGAGIDTDTRSADSCPSDEGERLEFDRQVAGVYVRVTL